MVIVAQLRNKKKIDIPSRMQKDHTQNGRKYLQVTYVTRNFYLECIKNPCCCCLVNRFCPTLLQPFGTVAHQAPLSMIFPRQESWSELSFPFPKDLPDPGIKPTPPTLVDRLH